MAIELISKIKPKNGGSFAMVDAEDVEMPNGDRLSDFVAEVRNFVKIEAHTQEEYDQLLADGLIDSSTVYLIVSDDE